MNAVVSWGVDTDEDHKDLVKLEAGRSRDTQVEKRWVAGPCCPELDVVLDLSRKELGMLLGPSLAEVDMMELSFSFWS